jgi:hypothetical protein
MIKNTPVITVTCLRDLPLLDLQAQSISNYLDVDCPIVIVVNEENSTAWDDYFNLHLRHYYNKHHLTIIYRADFASEWKQWIASSINPWAVGWETQQVLKLIVATIIKSEQYLVLDSQNFLIKYWTPSTYNTNLVPARPGHFVMPVEIWRQYASSLGIETGDPSSDTMSMCTPIFFDTDVVKQLIEYTGGTDKFATWFKNASRTKSEFILYSLWLEKLGGLEKYHRMYTIPEDWGNPMLRDCRTTEEFEHFLSHIGLHHTHAWVSANHRSWGNMTDNQYNQLTSKLAEYNLIPHFEDYRSTYVDIKI